MSITTVGWPTAAEIADRFWTLADLNDLDSNFFEVHKIEIVDGRPGIPAYWHVTQDEPPQITVFSLNPDGGYDEVGGPAAEATWPYPIDLSSGS